MIRRLNSDYYSRRFCCNVYMLALTLLLLWSVKNACDIPARYGQLAIDSMQYWPAYGPGTARILRVVAPTIYVVAVLLRIFVPFGILAYRINKATTLQENRELFWDVFFGSLQKSVCKIRLPMIDALLRPVRKKCARKSEKLIKGVGVKIYPTVYKLQNLLPENKKC